MPTINQLTAVDSVAASDQIPIYSSSNGDARKCSISILTDHLQDTLTFEESWETQYAAPSASGFDVAVTDGSTNIWLILTPVAGYAVGAITLPASSGAIDKQEVLVNCTQAVTTFTVGANGATAVTGEPSTLSANGYFRLKYDLTTSTWYRVG